jgi:membrane fusion protein, adhesin transport system
MSSSEDLNFVNILHSQKNAKIDSKVLLLFFAILVFFLGAFLWAYFSKIDELTRGEGKVIPSEKIKTIQSLDGGIISEILIKEGSIIKEGQPLMKIDTTRFEASLEENKQTFYHLLVTKARLEIESKLNLEDEIPQIKYSDEVLANANTFAMNDRKLFTSRMEELNSTIKTFKIQLKQKEQEINELNSKATQLKISIALIREETKTMELLVARQSKSKVDLLKIKRELAQLDGELQGTYASIPRAKYAIEEAQNKIVEKLKIFKSEASNELQKINTEIKKYESKLVADEDKLDKTILVSPVDGIVKQINVNTIGGVVKSGMDLIEIVPQSDILLIEAKIDPKDIAFINPQQRAIVKITAYDFSIYGGLEGKIVEISADSIEEKDNKDKTSYYKVVIKTEQNYLEKDKQKLPIIPGMITTVDIVTGKKSILDFLLKPILKTKANALHER